jgi:hypothetical protein
MISEIVHPIDEQQVAMKMEVKEIGQDNNVVA